MGAFGYVTCRVLIHSKRGATCHVVHPLVAHVLFLVLKSGATVHSQGRLSHGSFQSTSQAEDWATQMRCPKRREHETKRKNKTKISKKTSQEPWKKRKQTNSLEPCFAQEQAWKVQLSFSGPSQYLEASKTPEPQKSGWSTSTAKTSGLHQRHWEVRRSIL